jgi:DNA-binding transcriptional LysR family regulator
MNIDLNDLYYFGEIVRHGGIAAAERATREPKSKLSRRLAQLAHSGDDAQSFQLMTTT